MRSEVEGKRAALEETKAERDRWSVEYDRLCGQQEEAKHSTDLLTGFLVPDG